MMTFRWQTLCLVPAGAGCRFQFAVLCSLSRSLRPWHNDKLQVESWVNFVALSVSVDEVFLVPVAWLSPPVCCVIWGAAQHSVAFEIDEAFVVLANEAQITRQFLKPQHALLAFLCLSSSASATSSSLFLVAYQRNGLRWLCCSTSRTLCALFLI